MKQGKLFWVEFLKMAFQDLHGVVENNIRNCALKIVRVKEVARKVILWY